MEEDKTRKHPYLSGNFAPIQTSLPLTPCEFEGQIPKELHGGQYVRNGANPLTNDDLSRDAHWFDGDGMLSGVLFRRSGPDEKHVQPEFVNQFLLTDVYCYAKQAPFLRKPLLPSIASLVNPAKAGLLIMLLVMRSVFIVILSRLRDRYTIRKISVANTNVVYHDGRALATCESGPPLRVSLPSLDTIGWFNGETVENESEFDHGTGFAGNGWKSFMNQWTTAHPRVDPVTKEFFAFHSTSVHPFLRYSIIGPSGSKKSKSTFNREVPGVQSPKMMHDFGVSSNYTVIMDIPLILDPRNHALSKSSLYYDPELNTRFAVFPRYEPEAAQWFETNPCLIFHAANCWDECSPATKETPAANTVHLLVCRLTSPGAVFNPGNIAMPPHKPIPPELVEEDQCRLYYYAFSLGTGNGSSAIRHQWALSAIPFEFPTVPADKSMQECRYIYGCSTSGTFSTPLGTAAKIDHLAKIDAMTLIQRGMSQSMENIKGCVDMRTAEEIHQSRDPEDPIQLFKMPTGWYAQEPRFVPRENAQSEDDGFLLTYVFDESQLDDEGNCRDDAKGELWVIDARDMKTVVAKVKLPQRVPYGLHGCWFSEEEIQGQRSFERVRDGEIAPAQKPLFNWVRNAVESYLG